MSEPSEQEMLGKALRKLDYSKAWIFAPDLLHSLDAHFAPDFILLEEDKEPAMAILKAFLKHGGKE